MLISLFGGQNNECVATNTMYVMFVLILFYQPKPTIIVIM